MDELINLRKHTINLVDRKEIYLEGVEKLEGFDKNEFLLNTSKGYLLIKGEDLSLDSMDTEKGTIKIIGKINLINYLTSINQKNKKENFLKRLFK